MEKGIIKATVWSAIGGAVVMIVFVFAMGWVVSAGTAQEQAEKMAAMAVVTNLAPVCVERFQRDSNRNEFLVELKDMISWNRDDYVMKHGWAGKKDPNRDVASECARMIVDLE